MAAEIKFYAGESTLVEVAGGSGLGFYGAAGFGASVNVGAWQGRTYITNSAGSALGPEADNVKYINPTGAILGQSGSGLLLSYIPNQQATLNVRFTADTPVKVQNAIFRTYDRVNTSNPASGVTVGVYEVVHPGSSQTPGGSGGPGTPTISGQHAWAMMPASGHGSMAITSSPGTSGLSPSGSNTIDSRHDWYLALSASPDSVGTKLFAGFCQLEWL